MKIITKEFPRGDIYPIESITKGYTPILFDIETTGLSSATSYLYLIGAMEIKKDRLNFIQWFAEKPGDETEVLDRFFAWLPDRACLIHFNGRGFDVPYIAKKCRQYDMRCMISQMPNIDLYRSFAPLKDYFNMNSRRLVAYEQLIGLDREDTYNGGELINVYKDYVGKSKFDSEAANNLLKLLLLHNEEDIRDMVPVLELFTYMDLFNGNFKEAMVSFENIESSKFLKLQIIMNSRFPMKNVRDFATVPGMKMIKVSAEDFKAEISVPVFSGRLKHYFDDYKNYYYLPAEDMAVHKSVASGVDSAHREPASKETAYIYAGGEFVPQLKGLIKPNFKKGLKDAINFIPTKKLSDENILKDYVKAIFM